MNLRLLTPVQVVSILSAAGVELDPEVNTSKIVFTNICKMMHAGVMQGKEHEIVESLAKYVMDEYQNKSQEKVDTSDWPRRYNVWLLT